MASAAQAKAFIQRIAPIIQEEAKARGYQVCSPIIAQACHESGCDTSLLSMKFFNYFGLKCGSSWKGKSVNLKTKEEYTVGTLTTIRDNFRAYDNMEAGVKGYFDFISTKRYANLKTASTPEEYLSRAKADGYCTSSVYVERCMNYVNKYDLTKYDWNMAPVVSNPYKLTASILKMGMKSESVKWLQYELNKSGYGLTVDGIFGQKTKAAVMDYQKKNSLAVDGIVGKNTLGKLKA